MAVMTYLNPQVLTDGDSKLSLPTVSLEKSRYWSALMAAWWQKIIPSKNDPNSSESTGWWIRLLLWTKFKALPDASLQSKSTELRNRYMEAYKGFGGDQKTSDLRGRKEATKLERKRSMML